MNSKKKNSINKDTFNSNAHPFGIEKILYSFF